MTERPDVVIVGAGAGGGAAAWRLTRAGARVLLLEAGPRFEASRDYPLDTPGWERRWFPDPPGSRAEIVYGDLGRLVTEDADLSSFNEVTGLIEPGDRRRPSSLGYAHVQGVGGTTLHFVGEAHRLHPDGFRLRSRTGEGTDWPLTYDELEPHYVTAENTIGVAGPGETGERWRSAPYPLPPHPASPGAARLGEAAKALGIGWQVNPRAALSEPYDGRPPCNYCAMCARGCPLGDKGSTDVTFLRRAEATGRLDLRTGAQVTRLHPGRDGRIAALDVIADARSERIETPVLVLAGGAVQTPRLLLASAPEGLANGSGQVGRNFMETLSWSGAGFADGLTNSHMGLPADAISWDFSAPGSLDGIAGGYRLSHATQEIGLVGPIAYAARLIPGHGPGLHSAMRARFGSALAVGATGETIADAQSFVTIDPDRRDAAGVALPLINSVLTPSSLSLLRRMAEAGRRLLLAAGVETILEENSIWDRFTATHVFGTCRMAADATKGVVDPFGQSFDHANLYIADASVFPSTGGGEAPSLTIQALALRTAEAILSGR